MSLSSDDGTLDATAFTGLVEEMTASMQSVRTVIKTLREKTTPASSTHTKDGISLLSLKHQVMMSYLSALTLLSARRATGSSLVRNQASSSTSFSDPSRPARGAEPQDLVDSLIEGRIVLEKIKALEGRMRYQIEKLVRGAEEGVRDVNDDPLAFRPNPANLMGNDDEDESDEAPTYRGGRGNSTAAWNDHSQPDTSGDGIYRAPRLAPVPYLDAGTSNKKEKKTRRGPLPSALASLLHTDTSAPHAESTGGLGSMPSLSSRRAKELAEVKEFEETNFTRVMMGKKEAKRRAADEEDVAMGGTASGFGAKGRRRGAGWEDEFGDVLRSVGRIGKGVGASSGGGDGYEELRKKGRRGDVLQRSRESGEDRTRNREQAFGDSGEERMRKKSRFEQATKTQKKRLGKSRT